MAKTKQKVQMPLGIRKKMTAAVSMLLVACIMLVSSTYAWFVLSTAPEVKGISTQVGSNGNLEIALLNNDTYIDPTTIQTNEGDSMDVENKSVKDANITWGNLVDLNHVDYGLGNIILAPAELNLSNNTAIGASILRTPSYGSDGRVAKVNADSVTGTFANNAFLFNDKAYGVRAIGVASNLTLRQTTYRNALSSITTYGEQAKSLANNSLTTYGSGLATIMVGIATGQQTFDISYKNSLQGIVDTMGEANVAIGEGIKQATLAYALSQGGLGELEDSDVTTIVDNLNEATISEANLITATGLTSLPASITNAIAKYEDTNSLLSDAQELLNNVSSTTTITSTEAVAIADALVNREYMTICGTSANATKEDLIKAVIQNIGITGVVIEMKTGSGVYSNISDVSGNYTSQVTANITYADLGLEDEPVTAKMKTLSIIENGTQTSNYYFTVAKTDIQTSGEPTGTTTAGTTPISDTFGYALDFAFRTNASASNLLLQTAEKQRVYEDSNSAATQGEGSYMEFNATSSFDALEVAELMSAIRVAFVEPVNDGYTLLAVGKLEMPTDITETSTTVKAPLYLYDYEYVIPENGTAADGTLNVGEKSDTAAITGLTQNIPKKVSVIVYIDGNIVDNSMVANAGVSMSGKLNLQFASDATLTPMENSALRQMVPEDIVYTEITEYKNLTEEEKAEVASALGETSITNVYSADDGNYYYSTDGSNKKMMPTAVKNAIDEMLK